MKIIIYNKIIPTFNHDIKDTMFLSFSGSLLYSYDINEIDCNLIIDIFEKNNYSITMYPLLDSFKWIYKINFLNKDQKLFLQLQLYDNTIELS